MTVSATAAPDEDADTPAGDGLLATQGVFVP